VDGLISTHFVISLHYYFTLGCTCVCRPSSSSHTPFAGTFALELFSLLFLLLLMRVKQLALYHRPHTPQNLPLSTLSLHPCTYVSPYISIPLLNSLQFPGISMINDIGGISVGGSPQFSTILPLISLSSRFPFSVFGSIVHTVPCFLFFSITLAIPLFCCW